MRRWQSEGGGGRQNHRAEASESRAQPHCFIHHIRFSETLSGAGEGRGAAELSGTGSIHTHFI